MAAEEVKSLVFVYLPLNACHCSPTTELLETVMRLLNGCVRFYPQYAPLVLMGRTEVHKAALNASISYLCGKY